MKIFKCLTCGNTTLLLLEGGGVMMCCGQKMEEAKLNQIGDAIYHMPVVSVCKNKANIQIGKQLHPMTSVHHIDYVIIVTNLGYIIRKDLKDCKLDIKLSDNEKIQEVYVSCNLHGIWRTKVDE